MESKKETSHFYFRFLVVYHVLLAFIWAVMQMSTAQKLGDSVGTPINSAGMGYSGQTWLLVASLGSIFFCSATNNYAGIRASTVATSVILLLWWLENFSLMYTALNETTTLWNSVFLACMPSVDKNTVWCKVAKGSAVINIFIGIGLAVQLWAGFKRGKEIVEGAERSSVSGYKFISLGMRAITLLSLLGLVIMVLANIHLVGKSPAGAPFPSPGINGVDDSAVLLLIVSVFATFYVRDASGEVMPAVLRYAAFAATLCAVVFWSTLVFKARSFDHFISAFDPCNATNVSPATHDDCRTYKAYAAGFALIMASQTMLIFVAAFGSLKTPAPSLEI